MPEGSDDLFALVRRELSNWLTADGQSPETKLLKKYERRTRALREHTRSFLVVNGFLFLLWLTIAVTTGVWFPWFVFPLLGWGMGYTFHALGHGSWLKDHRLELERARQVLEPSPTELPPTASPWERLEARCETAAREARASLANLGRVLDASQLEAELSDGLDKLQELVRGAQAIDEALAAVVPDGPGAVDAALGRVDRALVESDDEAAKSGLHQQRALLIERKGRIEALKAEQGRIANTAEGSVLAAENLRRDAVRMGAGGTDLVPLQSSIQRLRDELDVLERVRDEIEGL